MKNWQTLKEIYSRHKKPIQIAIIAILTIALFVSGYLVSWNFMAKPLSNSQLELCEQVARDVYAQTGNVIVEVPEDFSVNMTITDFSVSMTTTTITVRSANTLYRGKVTAKLQLQNGELVMTRDMETGKAVFLSIIIGFIFIAIEFLISLIIDLRRISKAIAQNAYDK